MPRFDRDATVTFSYVVTADTKEEAEALFAEALGPDWAYGLSLSDLEHPRIEEKDWYTDISCLGPELKGEPGEANRSSA
jgi:hypothetical protein